MIENEDFVNGDDDKKPPYPKYIALFETIVLIFITCCITYLLYKHQH